MEYEYFYYYTTAINANSIILAGAIPPSLGVAGDYVPHGDGVYLTTLSPSYGRGVITYHTQGAPAEGLVQPIEVYIEISLPSNLITRPADLRNIQLYDGSLQLSGSQWSLRSFSGVLLATEYLRVTSVGGAAVSKSDMLGRFKLMRNVVTQGHGFVYELEGGGSYLYKSSEGAWTIGRIAGGDDADLCQLIETDPLERVWLYKFRPGEWREDLTITLIPCYPMSRSC